MTSPVLAEACRYAGLRFHDAQLLRAHSASVYLLPSEKIVARISPDEHRGLRPEAAVKVTRWLINQGFPATEPLDRIFRQDAVTVTFWIYYPQTNRSEPPTQALGALLRALHALAPPPFELPRYLPLAGLQRVLAAPSVLSDDDRQWLTGRTKVLLEQYAHLDSRLGVGMVHGDAYTGNTLWDGDRVRLGDWDEVSIAPRELDLANTFQGTRYGVPPAELDQFASAYGWDAREWPGFPILQGMRDLHTLTGFIRRAEHEPAAAAQLRLRIDSLRNPGIGQQWSAAS